jgi:hypothetical protein
MGLPGTGSTEHIQDYFERFGLIGLGPLFDRVLFAWDAAKSGDDWSAFVHDPKVFDRGRTHGGAGSAQQPGLVKDLC